MLWAIRNARIMPVKKKTKTAEPERKNTLLNFFRKSDSNVPQQQQAGSSKANGSGNRKASISGSSNVCHRANGETADDPVLISDDDEPIAVDTPVASSESKIKASSTRTSDSQSPKPTTNQIPSPFPAFPDFRPPPAWPEIINVGVAEDQDNGDDEDVLNHDVDGDGSVVADSEGEGAVDEGVEADNDPPPRRIPEPDLESPNRSPSVTPAAPAVVADSPVLDSHDGLLPDLVWDEPDEGMGMEDEADEEDSVVLATPPPVSFKRKRGANGASGKVEECPVCQKSLKGLANTVGISCNPLNE